MKNHCNQYTANKALGLCLILLLSGLFGGCGALELLDDVGGSGSGGGDQNVGPCHPNFKGVDTDGDGVSDECEALIGTNPNNPDSNGNGIGDGRDLPPGNPEDLMNSPWWQEFVNRLLSENAHSSVLTSSFLNQDAPAGTEVSVQEQYIHLILGGQDGQTGTNSKVSFCQQYASGEGNFLYFYIRGNVKLCPSCETKNDIMELCGVLPSQWTQSSFTQNNYTTMEDFTWHVGRTNAGTFNPEVIIKKNIAGTTKVRIKPKQQTTQQGLTYFNKADVRFDKTFQIKGSATPQDPNQSPLQIDTPEDISVERAFQRSGNASEGILGRFSNIAGQ